MHHPLRLTLAVVPLVLLAVAGDAMGKSIFGWIERVKLMDSELVMEAKLDTGADTSSINAPAPEGFDKDGEEWVRFEITDADGDSHTFERPVERTVRIRSAAGTTRRYVVRMDMCLGHIRRTAEINLADREDLSYQMLIGRNFMEGHVLVDSGPKFTMDPSCHAEAADVDAADHADDDEDSEDNGDNEDADQAAEDNDDETDEDDTDD